MLKKLYVVRWPILVVLIIIATGGLHQNPNVAGIDSAKVLSGKDLHNKLRGYVGFFGPRLLHWLTNFYMLLGKKVIIMGGGIHGCQTAEFLVKKGRNVTIVESDNEIGEGLPDILIRPYLLNWLHMKEVKFFQGMRYERITDKGLVVTTKEGETKTLDVDTIITTMPLLPDTTIEKALRGSASEIYVIGDLHAPGMIIDAIADGSRIGRMI